MSSKPHFAVVSVRGAHDVAEFLDRVIPTYAPRHKAHEWEEVRDALYAISNDSDAIVTVTDPADAPDAHELVALLKDLKEWGATMGGWESPVWDRLQNTLARIEP